MIGIRLTIISLLHTLVLSITVTANAQNLTQAQWSADLNQLLSAVREVHFKPFHNIAESEFDAAVSELQARLPGLSDTEIILEIARIIALLRDGHSRLHIPRLYPELALEAELGHSGTPPPKIDALKFFQSPLQYQFFDDGVFVIGATEDYESLIGHRVLQIDSVEITEILDAVKAVSFYENDSRAKLMAADRLALPQVLAYLGIINDPARQTVTTADSEGIQRQTELATVTTAGQEYLQGGPANPALWTSRRDQYKWYRVLEDSDAIYVQVNQFEEAPVAPYADFVAETLASARNANVSRYIVDLRHNSGGIGAWVTPFVTGLANSEYNEFGRLYILMGRTTFSAAQTFLHRFEEFSYALFVGEQSGAKPSHFGDGRRIVLENSGLTLRLSTIYWHSWLANDFRDAINPHISVDYNSAHFFEGNDPVLDAALNYEAPGNLASQMEEQFRQEKNQNGLLLYNRYMTDGRFEDHQLVVPDLLVMADTLIRDGFVRQGYFVYFLVNQSFPGDSELEADLARIEAML